MLSSGVLDLAIGLVFVFAVTAALSSAATELISRFLGLRGAYLLTGLRELVDGGDVTTDLGHAETDYQNVQKMVLGTEGAPKELPSATSALLGGPILSSQGMIGQVTTRKLRLEPVPAPKPGRMAALGRMLDPRRLLTLFRLPGMTAYDQRSLRSQCRSLPAYISATSFAEAVIDLVVPDTGGNTTMGAIQDNVNKLPASPFTQSLQALVKNAGDDVGRFRTNVERWYDDHMDRVSGWYKRHVAKITLAVGAILVVLLNINALTIGRTLYTESAVSTAVSAVAAKSTDCSTSDCLAQIQGQLAAVTSAGLPIGWGTVRDCAEPTAHCNWLDQRGIFSRHGGSPWQLVLVLIGFLIMVISVLPGAQFWFGLLTKLGSLRATGPKPAAAAG